MCVCVCYLQCSDPIFLLNCHMMMTPRGQDIRDGEAQTRSMRWSAGVLCTQPPYSRAAWGPTATHKHKHTNLWIHAHGELCAGSTRTHTHRAFTTLTTETIAGRQQVVTVGADVTVCLDVLLCRKCVSDLPGTAIPHPETDYAQHTHKSKTLI